MVNIGPVFRSYASVIIPGKERQIFRVWSLWVLETALSNMVGKVEDTRGQLLHPLKCPLTHKHPHKYTIHQRKKKIKAEYTRMILCLQKDSSNHFLPYMHI